MPLSQMCGEDPVEQRIERAWGWVLLAFAAANGLIILCLSLMITADVLTRWVTGRPFVGVFEISRILFVPVIFTVLALVQWTDRQVRVDVVASRTRGRWTVGLRSLDQTLALAFFGILLWVASESWLEAFHRHYVGMGILEIPQAVPIGFLVVGVALMVVTLLLLLFRSARQLVAGLRDGETLGPRSPLPPTDED